jgi:hypothetical protein
MIKMIWNNKTVYDILRNLLTSVELGVRVGKPWCGPH